MAPLFMYGDVMEIYTQHFEAKLDIGDHALKQNTPDTHNSWATRLRIQRLDGPSSGDVGTQDTVGIFSEDGRYRLDLGIDAVQVETPPYFRSWATLLKFRRLDGPNRGYVRYGHVVGIFSENGLYRLDIGTDAMKRNTAASHDSWATRLRIQDSQPWNPPIPTE